MKISSVTGIQNNIAKREYIKENNVPKRALSADDKVVLVMQGICVIGVAAVTNIILKENGINLYKMAKNKFNGFNKIA